MVRRASVGPADGRLARRVAGFADAYQHHRFAFLFVTLLVTLGAGPTLDHAFPRRNPLELLLALNLLAALASVARDRHMRHAFAVAAAFVAVRGLRAALGLPVLLAFSHAIWLTGIALVLVVAARHALGAGIVDSERIIAALDTYMLAGLLFGVAYWLLDATWPGSLAGGRADGPGRAIYFSFVTITTLGYGDIVPVSEPARGLAIVEAVSGQLYLAVLVARLVSLYSRQHDA